MWVRARAWKTIISHSRRSMSYGKLIKPMQTDWSKAKACASSVARIEWEVTASSQATEALCGIAHWLPSLPDLNGAVVVTLRGAVPEDDTVTGRDPNTRWWSVSPGDCLGAGGCGGVWLPAHQLTLLPGVAQVSLHPQAAVSPSSLLINHKNGHSLYIFEVFRFYSLALIAIFHQKKKAETKKLFLKTVFLRTLN